MQFPDPEILSYLDSLTPKRSKVLRDMEAHAKKENFPAVGPQVGTFLFQLVKLSGAKLIFELGSGFGYSAMWMAPGLPEGGQIICTELDPKKAEMGMAFLKRAKLQSKVLYEVGDALDSLESYQGPFDMVFLDLNKEQYPAVIPLAEAKLRSGGLLVADNVLWSGRVIDELDQSEATLGIREFNQILAGHDGFWTSILPLRDGVSLSIKK